MPNSAGYELFNKILNEPDPIDLYDLPNGLSARVVLEFDRLQSELTTKDKKLKAALERERVLWFAVSVSFQDLDGAVGDTIGDIKQIGMVTERLEEAMEKIKAHTPETKD